MTAFNILSIAGDIEDAQALLELVQQHGHRGKAYSSAAAAGIAILECESRFDAILIMADENDDGPLDLIGDLRSARDLTPILVLADTLDRRIAALNAGADDAIRDRFAFAELDARLAVIVRRARLAEPLVDQTGLVVDVGGGAISLDGRLARLSPSQMQIFSTLASHRRDNPVSVDRIRESLRIRESRDLSNGNIRVTITGIRKRIANAFGGALEIGTAPRGGYFLTLAA